MNAPLGLATMAFLAATGLAPPGHLAVRPADAAHSPPPAKPTVVLQRVAVPGTNRQMGMGIAEFPPHAAKPLHKATGPEVCYVLEGEVTVQVQGKAAVRYRRGDTFQFPANVVHVTTAGPQGAKVLAVWSWVPGKPFNIPAGTVAARTRRPTSDARQPKRLTAIPAPASGSYRRL